MLLRKLLAALGPLWLCVVVCAFFRLLDGWLGAGSFLAFAFKGLALGAALMAALPMAGIHVHTNGLAGWMIAGAGVLFVMLIYQFFEMSGMIHVPLLRAVMPLNGQVVLAESTLLGYMLLSGLYYRRR